MVSLIDGNRSWWVQERLCWADYPTHSTFGGDNHNISLYVSFVAEEQENYKQEWFYTGFFRTQPEGPWLSFRDHGFACREVAKEQGYRALLTSLQKEVEAARANLKRAEELLESSMEQHSCDRI